MQSTQESEIRIQMDQRHGSWTEIYNLQVVGWLTAIYIWKQPRKNETCDLQNIVRWFKTWLKTSGLNNDHLNIQRITHSAFNYRITDTEERQSSV